MNWGTLYIAPCLSRRCCCRLRAGEGRVVVGRLGTGFSFRNTWLQSWCITGSLGASCLAGLRLVCFMLNSMTSVSCFLTQPLLFLLSNTVAPTSPSPLLQANFFSRMNCEGGALAEAVEATQCSAGWSQGFCSICPAPFCLRLFVSPSFPPGHSFCFVLFPGTLMPNQDVAF